TGWAVGGDPLGGRGARRSADGGRARSAGAFADEDLIGVALGVIDLVRVKPEAVAYDLLENRLVALALGDTAREQRDRAGLVEPDLGGLEALRGRALDGVGEADAAQLAPLARCGAAALEAGEIGERERHVHALLELAAVVGEGEPGLERHGLGRNVVPAPQLGGIDAELVGSEIDQPLDHIGRLRAAVAA